MYHPFTIGGTLKTSWDLFKRNFAVIVVFTLIALIAVLFFAFWTYFFWDGSYLGIFFAFLLLLVIVISFLAFMKLVFSLLDNPYFEIRFKDIIPNIRMIGSYLILLFLLSAIMVFAGDAISRIAHPLTQKILNGLIGYLYQFFTLFYFPLCNCFIVDDQSGPFESLGQSFRLIKGNIIKYFILFLIVEGLIFVGSLTLVGILLAIPIINIILAVTYRKLIYSHQDIDDDIAETN